MDYKMQPTIVSLVCIHICKGCLELDVGKSSWLKVELVSKNLSKSDIFLIC
jgi:hypothetical protein